MRAVTRFGHVEIDDAGRMFVKVWKEVWNGSERIGEPQPHRFSMEPDIPAEEFLQAVDEALVKSGFPPVDASVAEIVKGHAAIVPGKNDGVAERAERLAAAPVRSQERSPAP